MPTNESYQEREEHTHTQKNKVGKACQYRCSEHLLKPLHQMAYDQWESGEKGPFHPAPFHPWNSQTYICLHTQLLTLAHFLKNRTSYGSLLKTRILSKFSKSLPHSSLPRWSTRTPANPHKRGHHILTVSVPVTPYTWGPQNVAKESSFHFICEEVKVQRGRSPGSHLTPSKAGSDDSIALGLFHFKQQLDCPTLDILSGEMFLLCPSGLCRFSIT